MKKTYHPSGRTGGEDDGPAASGLITLEDCGLIVSGLPTAANVKVRRVHLGYGARTGRKSDCVRKKKGRSPMSSQQQTVKMSDEMVLY